MGDKNQKFTTELLVLFFARQSFWSKKKEINFKSLLSIIYPYIISTFIVMFFMLFMKSTVSTLKNSYIVDQINNLQLLLIVVSSIIFCGTFYENFYFIKTNTYKTLQIFFHMDKYSIFFSNLVKTSIIALPGLVFICFYTTMILLFFLLSYVFSYFLFLFWVEFVTKETTKQFVVSNYLISDIRVGARYIFTVFGFSYLFKTLITPWISMVIFFVILQFDDAFFVFSNRIDLFLTGLFLSFIYFSSPNLVFGFLALNNEGLYLRAFGKSLLRYRTKWALILSTIQLSFNLIFFIVLSRFFVVLPLGTYLYLLLSLIIGYILINLIQIGQALNLLDQHFENARQLEAYKYPFNEKILLALCKFVLFICFILTKSINYSLEEFIIFLLFIIILIGIMFWLVSKNSFKKVKSEGGM